MVRHLAKKWEQWLHQFHFFLEVSENKKLQRKIPPLCTHRDTLLCVKCPQSLKGYAATLLQKLNNGLTGVGVSKLRDASCQQQTNFSKVTGKTLLNQPNVFCCCTSTSSNHSSSENSGRAISTRQGRQLQPCDPHRNLSGGRHILFTRNCQRGQFTEQLFYTSKRKEGKCASNQQTDSYH